MTNWLATVPPAVVAVLLQLALALFPSGSAHDDEDWSVEETQTKQYAYDVGAGPLAVEIDNFVGAIRVTPGPAGRVEATVVETVRAASRQRLAQARSEVTLQAGPLAGGVRFYVDGPFRCQRNCHGCSDCDDCFCGGDRWDDDVYEVAYDFTLRVPPRTDLTLRTVNGGDITVEGVEGVFLVRNVNGSVALERVAGSGKAHTVNGPVTVSLTRAPAERWKLVTVNGNVELRLPAASGIDLHVQTMNGEAWSDFPYSTLPPAPAKRFERDGRWVFRSEGSRLRLGAGGPLVAMETLNGDILVRKQTR